MKRILNLAATLPDWLTYAQAGELAGGMSRDKIRYYIQRGEIHAIKRRKNFSSKAYFVLVNKESFLSFLDKINSELGYIPVTGTN